MARWLLKAIDVVRSAVFVALCTKAICVQFYQDIMGEMIGSRSGSAGPLLFSATLNRIPVRGLHVTRHAECL